jgi:regulator of protease activity HflC (stomatin/prohibitin superfamily)
MTGTILGYIFGAIALILILASIYTVKQQTMAVIERFGKFARITQPGIHMRIPIVEKIAGRVSIRVRELEVEIKTKTNDNVFVDLLIAVQYFVDKENRDYILH